MTTSSNPRIFPWGVYRFDNFQWVLVGSFRKPKDAEDYANLYKRSTNFQIKVAFESVR